MSDDAFTSGSVSAFAGTNGLRKALLDWCVGTEVSSEALSGSGVSWSGSLAQTPVAPGSIEITYTIGGTEYTAQDDGVGNLSGTSLTTGTINYTTGAYSITFAASASGVSADYMSGEPGQDWKVLMERDTVNDDGLENPFSGSEHEEVILKNYGLSGQENVMIGIREWEYPGGNAYGWNLNVYNWYTDGMEWNANKTSHGKTSYDNTWNTWEQMPNLPMVDDTMYYWFFSNRQRIIVVVKVQSQYEACYLGFGRRYSAPANYAYPLVNKGSNYGTENYAFQNDTRRGLSRNQWGLYGYPMLIVDPGGTYVATVGSGTYAQGIKLMPMSTWVTGDGVLAAAPSTNRVLALPVTVVRPSTSQVLMDFDGVIALIGQGVQAEDFIRDKDNGKKYIVFPDVYRSGFSDHYAVVCDAAWTTTTTV